MAFHIYIDESGTFTIPNWGKPSISCVGAVAVAGAAHAELCDRFVSLESTWGRPGETKGRALGELEISQVIELLVPYDPILEIVAIEMARQTTPGIERHKQSQATALVSSLGPEHFRSLVEGVERLRVRLLGLSNQLYIQSIATWELLARLLQKMTLYYVQRTPSELDAFHWCIDAKDKTKLSDY